MFQLMEGFLYRLSALFFYPVIFFLFFLLARVFYSLGMFCREGWLRLWRREEVLAPVAAAIRELSAGDVFETELRLTEIIQQAEQKNSMAIQRARYSIKMGPTLGLIGTLMPMARALSSLSQGNLAGLSGQMITAFSTTVLGLVVGGLAYSIAHVRIKWQRQDKLVLARLAEERLQALA